VNGDVATKSKQKRERSVKGRDIAMKRGRRVITSLRRGYVSASNSHRGNERRQQ